MPIDIAFGLDDITRTAWSIAFSTMNGSKFDWDAFEFVKED